MKKNITEMHLENGITYPVLIDEIIDVVIESFSLNKNSREAVRVLYTDVIIVLNSRYIERFADGTVSKKYVTSTFNFNLDIYGDYKAKKNLRRLEEEIFNILIEGIDLSDYDLAKGGTMHIICSEADF